MSINKKKILFSILAGGQSKRFGRSHKTLAKISNTTILNHIIITLMKFSNDIIINTNDLDKFKNLSHPIVKDKFDGFLGPLSGIHASILWIKNNNLEKEWVFSVPSDTPFLPSNLLDKFLSSYSSGVKILVARTNNIFHPVVGMWHVSLLNSIESKLKSKNNKIMLLVKKHKYKIVDFDTKQANNFFNINTQEDLHKAKKIYV